MFPALGCACTGHTVSLTGFCAPAMHLLRSAAARAAYQVLDSPLALLFMGSP